MQLSTRRNVVSDTNFGQDPGNCMSMLEVGPFFTSNRGRAWKANAKATFGN